MADRFEIFRDSGEEPFRFQLMADDGTIVAVSQRFRDLRAAATAITAVRENAATGFIVDLTCDSAGPATGWGRALAS